MKYQVLFSLKNDEKVFMTAAVVIGALRNTQLTNNFGITIRRQDVTNVETIFFHCFDFISVLSVKEIFSVGKVFH